MNNSEDRALLRRALAAEPRAIAGTLAGSRLYGNHHAGSDLDAHLIVPDLPYGRLRPVQRMDGDLDLWLFPLANLTHRLATGHLRECETVWALRAGHGEVIDPRWEPFLTSLVPSFPAFVHTFQRSVDEPKHRVRLEIFAERVWRTRDTDPRLSERELGQYRSALAAS